MHGRNDFEQLMSWGERLRLYGQVQGAYYEQLVEQGFDADQAFQLVREWTTRTIGWTMSDAQVVDVSMFDIPMLHDPSSAGSDEDYLISPDRGATRSESTDDHGLRQPPFGVVKALRPELQPDPPADSEASDDDLRLEDDVWLDEDAA